MSFETETGPVVFKYTPLSYAQKEALVRKSTKGGRLDEVGLARAAFKQARLEWEGLEYTDGTPVVCKPEDLPDLLPSQVVERLFGYVTAFDVTMGLSGQPEVLDVEEEGETAPRPLVKVGGTD